MGKGDGNNSRASLVLLVVDYQCRACGSSSQFDGNGGEWCPSCRTDKHLRKIERLGRVEVELGGEDE